MHTLFSRLWTEVHVSTKAVFLPIDQSRGTQTEGFDENVPVLRI